MLINVVLLVCIVVLALVYIVFVGIFFFFKQKTAYELRISDWSSDVCSSDLSVDRFHSYCRTSTICRSRPARYSEGGCSQAIKGSALSRLAAPLPQKIGRASCRDRVCQYV